MLPCLVSQEVDDIFIAFLPLKKGEKAERVFLTKVDGRWASDYQGRRLVARLTDAIEAHLTGRKKFKQKSGLSMA